jgi:hypothetical protein
MWEAIQLKIVASDSLLLTICNLNQLESAILNLASNAWDAMRKGSALTIKTSGSNLDRVSAATQQWPICDEQRVRYGHQHACRCSNSSFRPLLHDQADWRGGRPRPSHGL